MKYVQIRTKKEPNLVIEDIKQKAHEFDFIIREIYDMTRQFARHGVDVEEGFEYYSIMICNPKKAYKSISSNKMRGAVLLPPKQIIVYRDKNETVVSYIAHEEKDVKELLPDDTQFQKGLSESCNRIASMIKEINKGVK